MKARALPLLASALAAGVLSCSLLYDTSGFTADGEAGDAQAGSDGNGTDAPGVVVSGDENCTNGIDDNDDGQVDCADPKCQTVGFRCAAIPDGWTGPYALGAGAVPPPCAGPFDLAGVEGHDDLQAPAAKCGCSCGAPGGTTCSATFSYGAACGTLTPTTLSLGCTNVSYISGGSLMMRSAITGTGGQCTPNNAPQEATTWGQTIRTCGPSLQLPIGGCAIAARCVPPRPAGFEAGVCIVHDGDTSCPADFPNKRIAYTGVNDTRACSCTCTPPACPTTVVSYTGDNCTGDGFAPSTTCTFQTELRSARITGTVGTSCTPKPGTATGTATPSLPKTICCAG